MALTACGDTPTGDNGNFVGTGGVGGSTGGVGGAASGGVGGVPTGGTGGRPTGGTGGLTGGTGGAPPLAGAAGDFGGPGGVGGMTGGVGGGGVGGVGGVGGDTGGVGGAGGTGGDPLEGHCLADITTFEGKGPFTYTASPSGSINMWIPDLPAGCKVPMIHLANGTTARCASYQSSLEHIASYGFIALCYESPSTGAGTQAVMAWDTALAEHGDIADLKFGSTGHSQGGQSAFCALRWAEEKWMGMPGSKFAGLAMQPASGFGTACAGGWQSVYAEIVSPMFMFSGEGSDGLVPQAWVQDGFDALDDGIEAYHWAKQGGAHIPPPNGEEMQISIPWFRWKLLGDNNACKAFKAIRETDSTWTEADVQNEEPCL
jgi:hypothetical protein